MTATEQSTITAATIPRAKAAAESASGMTAQPTQVVGVKALEPETTPRAAEVLFSQEGEVRFQKAYVHQDGSILADGHSLDLYGAMLIRLRPDILEQLARGGRLQRNQCLAHSPLMLSDPIWRRAA
jgi:hypothetical protein